MTRALVIGIAVLGILLLALGGWTVRGVRRALRGARAGRLVPATS